MTNGSCVRIGHKWTVDVLSQLARELGGSQNIKYHKFTENYAHIIHSELVIQDEIELTRRYILSQKICKKK